MEDSLAWYEIRDLLTGDNYVEQNVVRALELAEDCDHPEARWLLEVRACNLGVGLLVFDCQ